jgi:hypothetical protein
MAETGFDDCVQTAPRWVGASPEPGLSVAETLHEVELAGLGPDAQRLLTGLAARELSSDEWVSVVTLWEPQAAWLAGVARQRARRVRRD